MLEVDCIIIGQGIAGTLFCNELIKHNKTFIVFDSPKIPNCSQQAGAIINPLVAKKWSISKEYHTHIEHVIQSYRAIEALLNINILNEKKILLFPQDDDEEKIIELQLLQHNPYLLNEQINNPIFKIASKASIQNSFSINTRVLFLEFRNWLIHRQVLIEASVDFDKIAFNTKGQINYKNIIADNIVFCEGVEGRNNPFFSNDIFTKNKGDYLLLQIPNLNNEFIYHSGIRLVPIENDLFWCGSNYQWNYSDLIPNESWLLKTQELLNHWIGDAYNIIKHATAERPTTAGQKPLLEQSTMQKNCFRMNGLGTRGFTIGPTLAKQLFELVYK